MVPDAPRFAMVAGEASGDVLAGSLLASLRARWPQLSARGIGGPPLASAIPCEVPRASARASLGVAGDETLIALLPGSRRAEIQYIAPRLFGAAAEMSRARPGLRFVVPVVTGLRHAVEPLRKQ